MRNKILKIYSDKTRLFSSQVITFSKHLKTFSLLRLLSFLTGIIVVYQLFFIHKYWAYFALLFFISLFIFLLKVYAKYADKKLYASLLLKINQNEIKALKDDYSAFNPGKKFINSEHVFSFDLDIFGEDSLFHSLNRTCTSLGKSKLAEWFLNPLKDEKQIFQRQEAIKELSDKLEWRQDFLAAGYTSAENSKERMIIQNWLTDETRIFNIRVFNFIRYVLPCLTSIFLILNIFGVVPFFVITFLIVLQLGVLGSKIRSINSIHQKVSERLALLKKYANLLGCIERESFFSDYLNHSRAMLLMEGRDAGKSISKLAKIINLFDYRLNIIAGFILNALFLWDLQCVFALEKWRKKYKNKVSDWFDVIGQYDALVSLANFSFNNPGYVYPKVTDKIVLQAEQVGHPLIDAKVRVNNNFSVNKFGEITIVTGANMAGKSTFLRTIGVNLVLAMIGAPVCAKAFSFSVMDIFTSMRTNDSLQKNESYFYAELSRLKQLITTIKSKEKVFFILDEILKGTNSKDKLIGSKAFLQQVVKLGGTGLVATHDLKLTELEEIYPDTIRNMCFEIEINKDKMFFDYLIKDGVTQKMNASFLMKQMGIVVKDG